MSFTVTTLTAIFCGFFYVFLTINVARERQKNLVALGDSPNLIGLTRKNRAHGNFIEWAPLFLILLFLFEFSMFTPHDAYFAGIVSILFLTGRVCHAYSLLCHEEYDADGKLKNNPKFRIAGMMLTMGACLLLSAGLLIGFILSLFQNG